MVAPRYLPGRGRGLVALENLPAGTRVIFVPDAALVRPDSVLRLHPEWRSLKLDETALLGLFVARAQAGLDSVEKDEKGVFAKAAYDHLLSLGPCYAGIVSEASVLKRLPPHSAEQIRGEVREALVEWRKIVKANNGNKNNPLGVTRRQFLEGVCHRHSRSLTSRDGGHAIVPLIDWTNHRIPANLEVANQPNGMSATLTKAVKKGEEICNSYGVRNGAVQFTDYGFYDPEMSQSGSPIIAEIPLRHPLNDSNPKSPTYQRKQELWKAIAPLPVFYLIQILTGANRGQYGFVASSLSYIKASLYVDAAYSANTSRVASVSVPHSAKFQSLHTFRDVLDPNKRNWFISSNNERMLYNYLAQECHRVFSMIAKPGIVTEGENGSVQGAVLDQALALARSYRSILRDCFMTFSAAAKP